MGKNLFTFAGKGKPGCRMDSGSGRSQGLRAFSDQGLGRTAESGISCLSLKTRIGKIEFSLSR
jgi:hypothetical protein